MKTRILSVALLLAAFVVPSQSFAEANNRSSHKFGIYGSLLGDPFPGAWGINLGYNFADWARITAGYGAVSVTTVGAGFSTSSVTFTTIGGGLKFMLPNANLTPVVGLNFSSVTVSGTGGSINGITSNGTVLSVPLGFEWTASNGFYIGAGYGIAVSGATGGLPYLALGVFF